MKNLDGHRRIVMLAGALVLCSNLLQAQGSDAAAQAGHAGAEQELPKLADNLENLWDGSWHEEAKLKKGVAAAGSEIGRWVGQAIREHRDAFSSKEPGARETQLFEMRWALSQRTEPVYDASGITGRLAKKIIPIYEKLHQSLISERFDAALSLDAIRPDALGENLLGGDLFLEVIAYTVLTEKLEGEKAVERARAITESKVDYFIGWLRQRRKPDQEAAALVWKDWLETDAAYYSEPEPDEPAIQPVYAALRDWYFNEYLKVTATRVDEAVRRKDAYDASALDVELIPIVELLVDRTRYEEAFVKWLSENEKPLAELGIIPTAREHVHVALGVDAVSGKPLSQADTGKTAFLKMALYKKFLQTLDELIARRNAEVEAKLKALSPAQREQLKAMSYLFERSKRK